MNNILFNQLIESRVIAIIRGHAGTQLDNLINTLVTNNIKIIEVTVDTPDVYKKIEQSKVKYGKNIIIGAGTVLDPESAHSSISAGADFIVSPSLNLDTIKIAKRYGKMVIPGCMTPTEIIKAYEAGADAIKLFPASTVGSGYIKELSGPLGHIPLIPTGGITYDNAHDFLEAGAMGIGVGSALVGRSGKDIDLASIKDKAQAFSKLGEF